MELQKPLQCRPPLHSIQTNADPPCIQTKPMQTPPAFKNPLLTANADPPCIQPKRMQTPLAFKPNQCRPPLHCINFMPPKPQPKYLN